MEEDYSIIIEISSVMYDISRLITGRCSGIPQNLGVVSPNRL
jgi:hypothetical protein